MSGRIEAANRRELRRLRLESHLRAQYFLLVACVVVLALTGLPQKFESASLSRSVIDMAGGIENLQFIHRVAGGALVLTGIYHIVLVVAAVLVLGETGPLRMIPTPGDFRDAVRAGAYFLWLRTDPPDERGRRYFQKVDYWFMAWSLGIMAVTGLVNLLPLRMARLLSAEPVLAALRAHSDAAPLVVVWVVVVHLLYAGLTPRLFQGEAVPALAMPASVPVGLPREAVAPSAAARADSAMSIVSPPGHDVGGQGEDWEGPT